jgi:NAD(P)-dependent dehydrogenase (short-subunit alcohol dehydrogenase family)
MNTPEVVVVTGASAGLGRAIVREFAHQGAYVALLARNEERLKDAAAEVREMGGRAMIVPVDMADAEAVERAAARVEEAFGPIDVWVNNAMVTVFSPVTAMKPEEYRRVTEVNYLGYVHGTMAALKRMRPRDHGTIVQVGSALAYRAIPLQSAYCASKHAIKGFTESLRSELFHEKSRVHVVMVEMPALNTPQFRWGRSRMPRLAQPVPPIFQPEVGARAVYWSAHHRRRDLWVGWPAMKAILGERVVPGWLDRYLSKVAWDGQMLDTPDDHDRPDNLFESVDGHQGAHGAFDDRAKAYSAEAWLDTHRRGVLAAAAGVGVAAAIGVALSKRG